MSAFRAAPAGVFELQRSSSFRAPAPSKYQNEEAQGEARREARREGSDYGGEEEDEEEEVDESVREDMTKLEDTFPGISERFRLINRIGEGMVRGNNKVNSVSYTYMLMFG